MPPASKVEFYAAIRRDAPSGDVWACTGAQVQRRAAHGGQGVGVGVAGAAEEDAAAAVETGSFKLVIGGILRADLDAPRKQRHTVKRIFDRLVDEHAMVDVSCQVVRAYVAVRKSGIRIESGRDPVAVFVPQTHRPGMEAEVDFGEVAVRLRGTLVTCFLFSLRLSFSGKAVYKIFRQVEQEAFFEGHEYAFHVLGGVPRGQIRYDNLKTAVAQVLGFSRQRVEPDRWMAFRSHWPVDPFYCQPGLQGAHETGGVEGQIGWFRRNHLVPVPSLNY